MYIKVAMRDASPRNARFRLGDEGRMCNFHIRHSPTALDLFPMHHLLSYFNKLLLKRMLVVTTEIIGDTKNR